MGRSDRARQEGRHDGTGPPAAGDPEGGGKTRARILNQGLKIAGYFQEFLRQMSFPSGPNARAFPPKPRTLPGREWLFLSIYSYLPVIPAFFSVIPAKAGIHSSF